MALILNLSLPSISFLHVYFCFQGDKFSGKRTKESLFRYIMENVDVNITHVLSPEDWDVLMKNKFHNSWVLMLCQSNELPSCPFGDDRTKLAAILVSSLQCNNEFYLIFSDTS